MPEETAREVINSLLWHLARFGQGAPHLHVSDSIGTQKELEAVKRGDKFGYIRTGGHPDHISLEQKLVNFEGGSRCRIRSDGMGAISAAILAAGEIYGPHFIVLTPIYGGTWYLCKKLEKSLRHNFKFTFIPTDSYDPIHQLSYAIRPDTAGIIFEWPQNPTLAMLDVERIVHVRDLASGLVRHRPLLICDNTLSFGIFHPFRWGADMIAASGTKYPSGESAWSLGYVEVSNEFNKRYPALWKEVEEWISCVGGTPSPIETWITDRFSMATLEERILQHSRNAMEVAKFLETHIAVGKVMYPGLPSYPWRKVAEKYLEPIRGERVYGGMIAFYLGGADLETTTDFLCHLTRHTGVRFLPSFGGSHDMIASPMNLTHHYGLEPEDYQNTGIAPNLVRLSVGRDRSPEETIQDLKFSLKAFVEDKLNQ